MLRFQRKVPLSLISRSFGKSTVAQHVPKNVAGKLEELRTSSTSNGQVYLGHGAAPVTRSAQVEIVDALCLGERRRASSLLSELGHGKCSLTSNDFVYILKYCARTPDPLFVMETWRFMEDKQVDINGKCYLFIVRALCKGGYLKEAFSFINTLRENPDTYPILPMCNNFLGACAQIHSFDFANECLDLMERQMVGKNEVSYAELLKLAVLQQNLSAVHEIWKECIRAYSLSIISLRKFIWSFTRLRDLESAYITLQHMVALAFRGDSVVTRTAEGKLSTSRLDIPIPSNHLCFKTANKDNTLSLSEHFNKFDSYGSNSEHSATLGIVEREIRSGKTSMLRKQLSVPVMKVLRWSFGDVIHACGHEQNYSLAEQLMLQMQSIGLEPSCSTYDGFIRAVSSRGFNDALKVLKVMQQKNMKPYDSTLATISISCSRGLELDIAEAFLDQMSESSYIYPYNAFLEACDSLDQPERAVRVLAKMKQLKLQPDIRTYELLFSLFGNVNAPYEEGNMLSQVDAAKRINAIEMDMINNGIQHSHLSMKNLLKALGAEGMIRELIQYLHRAENQFTHNGAFLGTAIYNIVLHSLVEAKESRMAIEIFKTMKACGFLLDAATYNIMIDCCSVIRCFKSACALVSLMIRDGYCLQVTTYTALMKIFLGDKNFDGALNLMDQGISEGIQPDILLYNTILQEACEEGRIDVIELVVKQMHQTNIRPDPSTCSYVFSAYVDQGFFSTAVEALQVLSMQMISEEGSRLQEMRSELESIVFAEDSDAESQILRLFNKSEVNLATALLNLRWCATLGFPISWFPNQSAWANGLLSSH